MTETVLLLSVEYGSCIIDKSGPNLLAAAYNESRMIHLCALDKSLDTESHMIHLYVLDKSHDSSGYVSDFGVQTNCH
jgi:hypothetical protein